MRRAILGLACAALLVGGAARADALVAASVPPNSYATPVLVAVSGQPLTYVNGDVSLHDVVALPDQQAVGEDGLPHGARPAGSAPWCGGYDPFGLHCPLFWTPLLEVGGVHEVLGLEDAEPGELYRFHCTEHPWMQGELVVVSP